MIDLAILRLQYEILNTSLDSIAAANSVPVELLQREATEHNWKQYWPDDEFSFTTISTPEWDETVAAEETAPQDAASRMALESEQYIDMARKRLAVYSLAKETMLAHRYLALECDIIKAAQAIVDGLQTYTPQDIKYLSAVIKDLTSNSNLSNLASISIKAGEDGIPSVTIRDLSGRK